MNKENEKMLKNYFTLINEFDYEKNGIQATKDFIKYLLYDLLLKAKKTKDI